MNFGWFTNYTSDTEFSRTIIYEFGHALGLHHEHQSPTANIQWNKEKVYEYYGEHLIIGAKKLSIIAFLKNIAPLLLIILHLTVNQSCFILFLHL